MSTYKDFNYIKYLFSCCHEEVFEIYSNIIKEKTNHKSWQLFLAEVAARNYIGSYEDYKKQQEINYKNKSMTQENKKEIEDKSKKIEKNIKKHGVKINIESLL